MQIRDVLVSNHFVIPVSIAVIAEGRYYLKRDPSEFVDGSTQNFQLLKLGHCSSVSFRSNLKQMQAILRLNPTAINFFLQQKSFSTYDTDNSGNMDLFELRLLLQKEGNVCHRGVNSEL